MTDQGRIDTQVGYRWPPAVPAEEREMRCALPFWFNLKSRQTPGRSDARHKYRCQWPYVLALGILGAHCLLAANSSVTGSVVDDSGHPIAGARVLISYAPSIKPPTAAPPVIAGSLAAMVTADNNGTFLAGGLGPGQYIACAETTAPGYLDPCHWATAAPGFSVNAGTTTPGVKIVMARGAVLWVHIDDPQKLLKPAAGPVDLYFEIHVVTAKGFHYSAPIQSSTAAGRDHAITIPFDIPLNLRVLSAHLAVNDQSGNPMPPAGTTVNAPGGSTPPVIGLTIAGKKQ